MQATKIRQENFKQNNSTKERLKLGSFVPNSLILIKCLANQIVSNNWVPSHKKFRSSYSIETVDCSHTFLHNILFLDIFRNLVYFDIHFTHFLCIEGMWKKSRYDQYFTLWNMLNDKLRDNINILPNSQDKNISCALNA